MGKSVLNVGGYTILKRLGTGARSTIYLANDGDEYDSVALKRVIFEKPEDSRVFEQMENEYKVANKIDHPYVRKCYELTKIRSMFKVKEMLLSMEYFEGRSLEEGPALSLVDVMLIFRMVANGLNAMHQQGYVHCDMKPNNILFDRKGSLKIIDLGQSCKIGTTKKRIQGTPDYIAPEQVKRRPMGPKTDIFNLGATMYWALTGKHVPTLIPKKNKYGMMETPKDITCKAPHEIKSKIPVNLSKLVVECIQENPAGRPRNMMDIIQSLDMMIHSLLGSKIKANKNGANGN